MRLGLTYDCQTDSSDERQAEFDPPATLDALERALASLGHGVARLGSAADLLGAREPLAGIDLVFNIAEGAAGRCREAWVPILLELWGVPYVGSDPLALALGLDKVMSKRLMRAEGIRTPEWISLDRPEALPPKLPFAFPVIVKPRYEGSARGIDAGALVRTMEALASRARWLFERCPEGLLIEAFIPYGELTVCIIGNDPPVAYPSIQRPIDPLTRLSSHVIKTKRQGGETPLLLDEPLDQKARSVALAAFRLLGCRDMARVDLRVDERGEVYFLEINPLPSLDPEGSIGLLAEYLGSTYTELVGRLVGAACSRLEAEALRSQERR